MSILLTGFSSNIGKSIIQKYTNEGKFIFCLGRKENNLIQDNIDQNFLKFFFLDFSSDSFELSLEKIFVQLKDKNIETVIHAAADIGRREKIYNLNYQEIKDLITINHLNSAWFLKKSCDMLSANKNSINRSFVYLSTQLAKYKGPGLSLYSSSKAAMNNLCRTLSDEYAPFGIRINVISPGIVSDDPYDKNINISNLNIPLQRLATPEDVVNAIDFLISLKSQYITGTNLDVNGGR